MKIKKLLAGIMSAVMVLGIMTFPTFAEETYTVKVGENQYKTLVEALNAVYKSGPHNDPVVIDCVAGADVGAMTHGHVADSIIINGNGAYVSSGERDLEFDTYKFSRSTGAQDNTNGKYLEKDISIKVNRLNGIAAWSQRNTKNKVDLEFTDCKNMQRVYLSGGKYTAESGNAAGSLEGINNITLTNCTFDRTTVSETSAYPTADKTSVYSNNPGTIKITNCNFTEIPVAVNITNKSQGHQDITVENCTFKDCSSTIESGWADFAAPIRFVTKDENATSTVKISNCTIAYSEGNTNAGNGDILLGDKRTSSSSADNVTLNIEKTAANIQIHHTGDIAETVKKVSVKADEKTTVKMAEATAVAKVGETEYETLAEAAEAIKAGETLTLLDDVTVTGDVNFIKKNNIVFDGANHKISYNNAKNGIWFDNCSGITVKDATFDGTSVYGIVFDGGTNKKLINVKMSGDYTFAFMNLSTGGATLENCELSNNNTGKIVNGYFASSVWANVDSAKGKDMLSLINSKVDGITINGYDRDRRNYLMPKIDVGTGSETKIYTYDDSDYSKTRLLCVSPDSEGTYSVYQITDETTGTISGALTPVAKAEVKVDILNSEGKVVEQYDSTVFYETLAGAIEAAKNGGKVILLCDTAESVVIGAGQEITLDLNGKTLTNVEKQHTITNNGKLTVTDSSESKSGAVDNISHKTAALFNAEGATAELNGGKFLRSKEAGTDQDTSGGNSWYTIANKGAMTINAGVTVENKGYFSSNIVNGYYDTVGTGTPTLTINGGTFTGGVKTIKVDECGVLTITGGTFTNEKYPCIMNWNKTEISGGTFTSPSSNSVFNGLFNNTTAVGSLTIAGGAFEGGIINSEEYTGGNISISGGTFSTDVSEYCVDGFKAVKGADGRYTIEEANWGKYTDSGCYVFNDTKYGMMRFMFAFTGDITGKTIQSYGIKYINANKLDDELTTDSAVSKEGSATAFQGDIVGIDYDTANTSNYYAAAYIKFDDNTVIWSAPQKCKINWNRTFTKYAPQTSEKRR